MALFRRKKEDLIQTEKEPEGNANLAKQLKQSQFHYQKPTVGQSTNSQPANGRASADNQSLSPFEKKYEPMEAPVSNKAQGKPFYQFMTMPNAYGKRTKKWFIGMSIFFAAIVVINLLLGYYMSAIVIVLLTTLLFIGAAAQPKEIQISLYSNGLLMGEQFYPWSEFEKFWILYEPPELKQVHFKRRGKIISELVIELGDEHPLKIRDLLLPLLPEDPKKEESRIDLVSRTFKL